MAPTEFVSLIGALAVIGDAGAASVLGLVILIGFVHVISCALRWVRKRYRCKHYDF